MLAHASSFPSTTTSDDFRTLSSYRGYSWSKIGHEVAKCIHRVRFAGRLVRSTRRWAADHRLLCVRSPTGHHARSP
ncbi:hypothetical protein BQ8420_30795 [Nocardiopsis sp. JB363]|nr:hypothetical protein BQ8420_30795 [Nocardiopsis sp. JB363]